MSTIGMVSDGNDDDDDDDDDGDGDRRLQNSPFFSSFYVGLSNEPARSSTENGKVWSKERNSE